MTDPAPRLLTLGFDTSAAHCAAALVCGTRLLAARAEPMAKGHAERLFPLLEEMLFEAGLGWRDLDVIGVGTGPGNFTGVRIAVSAARGLALSLGIPAHGVSAFDALVLDAPRPALGVIDARAGRRYLQRFDTTGPHPPMLAESGPLPPELAQRGLVVIGHLAADVASELGAATAAPALPVAVAIARLAADRGRLAGPRPAPLYLRAVDAALPADPPPVILP